MRPSFMAWRPLRLLLVTETFPPEVNGVSRTLGRWVDAFRARGHEVQLIRPRQPNEKPLPEHVHGVPLPFYPQMRFGVASPIRLRAQMDRSRLDLVHIATEGPLGLAALLAAGSLSLPVASSFHTNYDHYLSHYGLGSLEYLALAYLRWFHNQTLVTLAPSESSRRRLTADGIQRVEIWSRGVDRRLFNPRYRDDRLRRSLGMGPDDVLLLYVGRIASEKNLPTLLRAFGRLRQRLPEQQRERVRLALVGNGPLLSSFQAQTPPGVILAGEQRGETLARWYASADVFAFPSCSETFGNAVLEAQASGLPVVAFEGQAMNERLTSGVEGLLAPPTSDLADALLPFCLNRNLRESCGRAGRHRAEKQTWEAIFDQLEDRYLRLAAPRREPAVRPALQVLGA
jgi:glycosyltransferase involved in cell wall biosynthesis